MKRLLVTGSSGLIGSEIVDYFSQQGWLIDGVDNNMRANFFGPQGDTHRNQLRLSRSYPRFRHHEIDIRDRPAITSLIKEVNPSLIVHAAAQPSHDLAASRPFDDFEVNAVGTLNVLQGARVHSPEAVFVHMSTNKVYGDRPNRISLKESRTRWEYDDPLFAGGIAEDLSIDQSKHSLFGASKVAADVMVQEYGRYFGMATCCLRGGCLTGPNHAGVELHGFLSYLIKCNVEERIYKIFGYKGKQVRDNIHALDVARFVERFFENPRSGEVYNLGGGEKNSLSILEAFERIGELSGKKMKFDYVEKNREGDHMCYISDLSKARRHYPAWDISKSLDDIFTEIYRVAVDAKVRDC